jgi:NDP-sugar pyrophosphorylase family protein
MTIIILAGGLGTRLREIEPIKPKPMIEVCGKPFLFWLIQSYVKQGYQDFIISTGYKAELIESYDWNKVFPKIKINFHSETTPLGTGGAVRAIFEKNLELQSALVLNGDTYLSKPLPKEFCHGDEFLKSRSLMALYTVLLPNQVFDANPNLICNEDRVIRVQTDHSLINSVENEVDTKFFKYFDAGAVLLSRNAVFSYQVMPPVSLHTLLSDEIKNKRVGFFVLNSECYDIGTPKRYERFVAYIKNLIKEES